MLKNSPMKIAPFYLVLADRVIRIFYGFGTIFFLVNIASPETFGVYSLQLAVFASMSVLANIGLEQISTKYFVQDTFPVGAVFLARLIGAVPFAIINYYGLLIFVDEFDSPIALTLSFAILLNYNALIFSYYNSRRELAKQLKNTIFMLVFSGAVKLYALMTKDVDLFFVSVVLDGAIPLGLFVFHEKVKAVATDAWNLIVSRKRELAVLCLAAGIVQLNARSDFLILYSVVDDAVEVSRYSLALKLADVFAVAASILLTSITPVLFSSQEIGKIARSFRIYLLRISMLLVGVLLLLFLLGPLFVSLVAGEVYVKSVALAMWIICAHFFGAIAAFLSIWYINIGEARVKLFRSMALLCLTIVLTYFLARENGAFGAAAAVALSNFVVGVVMIFMRSDTREMVFKRFS